MAVGNADDALVPPPDPGDEQPFVFDATAAEPLELPPSTEPTEPPEAPSETSAADDVPEQPAEFDPQYREEFKGVLFIGYLEREWTFMHHRFRIATPTRRERMQIGLAIKEYKDTPTWEVAWQAGVVAAFLISIDGEPLPEPVTKNSNRTPFMERLEWVIDNLYDPTIDEVYTKAFELWSEVDVIMERMGKASG